MEKFYEIYSNYRDYILAFILFVIFTVGIGAVFWHFSSEINSVKQTFKERRVVSPLKDKTSYLVVDIKGEVRRPGVYFLDEGKRVIDVVKKAGGFTVYADSSANNLSMKIKDEMVIVIYSESEIANYVATKEKEEKVKEKCSQDVVVNNSCIGSSSKDEKTVSQKDDVKESSAENSIVNINTATLEELMTLSGIGESKAKAIIEYRKTKKFSKIEDLKEVSGIGDALFEKVKDSITV